MDGVNSTGCVSPVPPAPWGSCLASRQVSLRPCESGEGCRAHLFPEGNEEKPPLPGKDRWGASGMRGEGGLCSFRFGDICHATLRRGTAGLVVRGPCFLAGYLLGTQHTACALLNSCSTKPLLPQPEDLHVSPRTRGAFPACGPWKKSPPSPHLFVLWNR